jgi:hypothetical protein
MKALGVDDLGVGRQPLSTYKLLRYLKGRSKISVAKARLNLFSSMPEKSLSKGTYNKDLLVCLLPKVSNQQYNKKMQEITPTTIQSRSFVRNSLTYHEDEHKKTLVVNLP